jgi:periplasmic protein TonB
MKLHQRAGLAACVTALVWACACGAAPAPSDTGLPAPEQMPKLVKQVPPVYPEAARQRGETGIVLVRALVDRSGKVSRVEVAPGKGVSPELNRAATNSVRQWMFEPAKMHGRATQTWIVVPVRFQLTK